MTKSVKEYITGYILRIYLIYQGNGDNFSITVFFLDFIKYTYLEIVMILPVITICSMMSCFIIHIHINIPRYCHVN
jgi:hypothetical protein